MRAEGCGPSPGQYCIILLKRNHSMYFRVSFSFSFQSYEAQVEDPEIEATQSTLDLHFLLILVNRTHSAVKRMSNKLYYNYILTRGS